MSNEVRDIDIENGTYYFFSDIINIENFEPKILKQMKINPKMLFAILDM